MHAHRLCFSVNYLTTGGRKVAWFFITKNTGAIKNTGSARSELGNVFGERLARLACGEDGFLWHCSVPGVCFVGNGCRREL